MTDNQVLIIKFYMAFQNKDFKTMQGCYADNATFSDEAFKNLNASQVRAMWEMLISRGKDLTLIFKNVQATPNGATAEWVAYYTFSKTGRKVENHIKASFIIENGKIVQHLDQFNFHKWSKQALGTVGLLLGWTSFFQNKVSETAMSGLADFMKKNKG